MAAGSVICPRPETTTFSFILHPHIRYSVFHIIRYSDIMRWLSGMKLPQRWSPKIGQSGKVENRLSTEETTA